MKTDSTSLPLVFFTWFRTVLPMKKEATWSGSTFWRRSLLTFSMVSISSLSVLKQWSNRKSTRQPSSSWEVRQRVQTWATNVMFVSNLRFAHVQQTEKDDHTYINFLLEIVHKLCEHSSTHTYLSGKYEAHNVKDDQPNAWHDLRVLQHTWPAQ